MANAATGDADVDGKTIYRARDREAQEGGQGVAGCAGAADAGPVVPEAEAGRRGEVCERRSGGGSGLATARSVAVERHGCKEIDLPNSVRSVHRQNQKRKTGIQNPQRLQRRQTMGHPQNLNKDATEKVACPPLALFDDLRNLVMVHEGPCSR